MPQARFNILVIDQDPMRAALICEGLADAGHTQVTVIGDVHGLARRIEALAPDIIIIDLASPHRDLVEHLFQISRMVDRPVAMFVDRSDDGMLAAAIDAGVSAYVVDGLRRDRVAGILDMAMARYKAYAGLRRELKETRDALEDRKMIDRAKAILMKARGIDEAEAYRLIRTQAMQAGQRMGEIARVLVMAAPILGDPPGGAR